MQHPRPKPGARDRFDASLGSDASESIPASRKLQARPVGPRPRRRDPRARFARRMVFEAFKYKHARAIDYDRFVDRKPDQAPRTWGASS